MSEDKISIVVVDDHPVVLAGLKALLKEVPYFSDVASFATGSMFIEHLKANEVDIVLLDMILPDGSGADLCKEVKQLSPHTKVLGLSNQAERSLIVQMLQNGANGYMLKNASADELLRCIEVALDGDMAMSDEVKEIMAKPCANALKEIPSVTKREKEILNLLTEGKTTAMIAGVLHLSPLTVETHRRNLLQKFDVRNTAELLMLAIQQKLL